MTHEWPQMTLKIVKMRLLKLIIPTKLHDHTTFNTNRTPKSAKQYANELLNLHIVRRICLYLFCSLVTVLALPLTKYHNHPKYHSQENVSHQKTINYAIKYFLSIFRPATLSRSAEGIGPPPHQMSKPSDIKLHRNVTHAPPPHTPHIHRHRKTHNATHWHCKNIMPLT